MISPALAIIGAPASKTAASNSDLNIVFSFTIGAADGLLQQYYEVVNPYIFATTPNSFPGAQNVKKNRYPLMRR